MSRTPLVFSLDAPFKLSKRYRMAAFGGIVITSIIVLTSTLSNLGPVSKLDLAELEGYKSRWKTYIPDTFKFEGFTLGGSGVPCDPLLQPGFTNAGTGAWETLNPECPGENFARPIRDTPEDELWDAFPEFRNKSILFAGDSVGRHLFEWFCFLGKTDVALSFPPGFENIQYGPSSYCTIPGLGMKVAQIHTYSLTNTSDPYALDIVQKWFPGGKDWDLRSRVDRFFETTLQDFQPDYIQLNSGPWDFRYWFLRDNIEGIRQDDLALEDREEAAAVAVQALDYFQAKFSGAKVWYMHPPMADENDYRAKMIVADPVLGLAEGKSLKPEEYPPFYTYRRQAQYRATMRQRIAEAGHDSLDYAQIQQVISPALFYKPGDAIHPQEKAKWAMSNMILTKMAQYARYGV